MGPLRNVVGGLFGVGAWAISKTEIVGAEKLEWCKDVMHAHQAFLSADLHLIRSVSVKIMHLMQFHPDDYREALHYCGDLLRDDVKAAASTESLLPQYLLIATAIGLTAYGIFKCCTGTREQMPAKAQQKKLKPKTSLITRYTYPAVPSLSEEEKMKLEALEAAKKKQELEEKRKQEELERKAEEEAKQRLLEEEMIRRQRIVMRMAARTS